jgi:hypothetical protein
LDRGVPRSEISPFGTFPAPLVKKMIAAEIMVVSTIAIHDKMREESATVVFISP